MSGFSFAQDVAETASSTNGAVSYAPNSEGFYVAKVKLHTSEELKELFDRAESYLASNNSYSSRTSPIEVVLHGPEVRVFQRKNYQQYKMLVDQAARLDAYKIVDIRVCEIWMEHDGVQRHDLPPFVDTVPNGPLFEEELVEQGYKYF